MTPLPDSAPIISIVDDDPSVRRALHRLVRLAGYVVETFPSGGDFLASAAPSRTACLVLDLHLGAMNGFELRERLAADGARFPIILITAYDDGPTAERVRHSGVAAYLRKPFDEGALLEAIRQAVGPWEPDRMEEREPPQ